MSSILINVYAHLHCQLGWCALLPTNTALAVPLYGIKYWVWCILHSIPDCSQVCMCSMDAKSDILLCWQFDPINDTRRRFKVSWRSMPPHLLNIHVHTCATQAFLPVRHNYSIIPALAAVKCILHVQLRPGALLQILKGLQSRGFQ